MLVQGWGKALGLRTMLKSRSRGLTLTELMLVLAVIGVLASILAPVVMNARKQAAYLQCTSNLRQITQAVTMYDIDINRYIENFPDRMTHLCDLGYVTDERIFLCPADYTRAKQGILKHSTAFDKKEKWAERASGSPLGTLKMRNSSYLYEFSTFEDQTYNPATDDDLASWDFGGFTFPSDFLVEWLEVPDADGEIPDGYFDGDVSWEYTNTARQSTVYLWSPPNPAAMDRDGYINKTSGKGYVTLQEAKFWQINNGDVYTTGLCLPGERGIPEPEGEAWFLYTEPYDAIFAGDAPRQHGYPRTWVPLARCFWHTSPATVDNETLEQVLNVAVDGNVFYSVPFWEYTAWKYGRTHWDSEDW
jgi:prepilin-type N-terminal cleavage/methylation domain-containing protein